MKALLIVALLAAVPAVAAEDPLRVRAEAILKQQPVIDGHNDWPMALRMGFGEDWWKTDLTADSRTFKRPLHTDIPRLRAGHVGGQFWSVYVPASVTGPAAVKATLEQIDIVHGMAARYPQYFELARTAADVRRIQKAGRIASLLGVEGGSQIDNSLAVLRMYHDLGVGYMTLTHTKHNDWADSANEAPRAQPLTDFGKAVIGEMNRIGMLVDLSHVSPETMRAVLAVTKAPVIFSHSSARGIADHPRNVPDDVLRQVAANGGVVMVNYVPQFIDNARIAHAAARSGEFTRLNLLYLGQPARAAEAMAAWDKANPAPVVPLSVVADHIDHIVKIAGIDHVGIGADYDGIDALPIGLEGVETYPALFAELLRRGWKDDQLMKLSGGNILRAMAQAETVATGLKNDVPSAIRP
ncbi:dipeptidase [Polymorphobacter sp.]|uniref:dipeptidase n=1 Tax=Polymorphobacter sp. TaxID=1909290 RepID=UPI003F6E4E46